MCLRNEITPFILLFSHMTLFDEWLEACADYLPGVVPNDDSKPLFDFEPHCASMATCTCLPVFWECVFFVCLLYWVL